jgi:hypothetical protein
MFSHVMTTSLSEYIQINMVQQPGPLKGQHVHYLKGSTLITSNDDIRKKI